MTHEKAAAGPEAEIRSLLETRAGAIRTGDPQAIAAANASHIVTYDVLPPLVNTGADGVEARTRRWLESYADGPGYELRDLQVVAGETVALAFYLYRVSGTLRGGGQVNMWVRCTVGLQKSDGAWRIVHEHDSVPFDPATGRAVLDAQP